MVFKRRLAATLGLVILFSWLLVLAAPPVLAQNLTLNLKDNKYAATINQDGTVDIIQDLTFVIDPNSAPLDYVDVGLPNDSYDLSQVTASLDGAPLTGISSSQNIAHGLKVVLEPMIQPGQTGTLRVEATVSNVLYQDSSDKTYASFEFSPTYFDSQYVQGTTNLEVDLTFPPGLTADEPRYHKLQITQASTVNDRQVYTWINDTASGSEQYVFGASFPSKYVAAGVVQKPPAFSLNLGSLCGLPICWIGPLALFIVLFVVGSRSQRRRKMDYLPPSLAVEGTGVKRGLTAVEAAVLLEAPLDKVMTMILFGLVKKGYVTVESEKPLMVKAVDRQPQRAGAQPQGGDAQPQSADGQPPAADAQPQGAETWYYEQRFLKAIKADGTLDEDQLHEMILDLISQVNKKLSGFSRKESQTYYKDIAARAWKDVEDANTPEVLGQKWSDGLEWTMLDDNWDHHTQQVFQNRPVVLPMWWLGYRPWAASAGVPTQAAGHIPTVGGGGMPVTLPTLPGADFANTVVKGVQNASNTVVGSIQSFTGKVVAKTNPPAVVASSSTRSYGGGHSCACACACAGCACACAGGGR